MSAVAVEIEGFDAIGWLSQPITLEDLLWYEKQIYFAKGKLADLLAAYRLNQNEFEPMALHPYAVEEGTPDAYHTHLINIGCMMRAAYNHHFKDWFLPPDPMPRQFECWPPSVQRRTGQKIGIAFDRQQDHG